MVDACEQKPEDLAAAVAELKTDFSDKSIKVEDTPDPAVRSPQCTQSLPVRLTIPTATTDALGRAQYDSTRLMIENIDLAATEADVKAMLSDYAIESIVMINSYLLMQPTGYCFVDLKTRDDALKLMTVSKARPFVLHGREVVIKQTEA